MRFNPDPVTKLKAAEDFMQTVLPNWLRTTEKLLKLGGGKFFVSKQVKI